MSSLFDDDDDDAKDEASDAVFGHNKDYAARFERRKKKQELSRLQQLHGDDEEDSEDAESEDEDAKLLTPASKCFSPLASSLSRDRSMYSLPPSLPRKSGCHDVCARQRGSMTTGMILATPLRCGEHESANSNLQWSSSPLGPFPEALVM